MCVGALTLVITPLTVRIVGMEAYGLVGFIAILQVVLSTFDLGLSTTLTRSVSADQSPNHSGSQRLVNSAAMFFWSVAGVIAVAFFAFGDWVAKSWLQSVDLPHTTVTLAVQIIGIYLALRWPVALYAGVISGLQRMEVLNLIKVGSVALRLLGGVAVLLWRKDLPSLLVWFAVSALVEVIAYVTVTHRLMPGLHRRPSFSWVAVKPVWRFALSMNLIALLAMLLTQLDRIIISKVLSLESLGLYSLAYNTAVSISLIQTATISALLPSLASDFAINERTRLLAHYNKGSQLTAYVITLPSFLLIFFGYDVLSLWITPAAAEGAYIATGILALGFLFNAAVANCYAAAVASGHPSLPLHVNLAGAVFYLPSLYWLIIRHGIVGAALAWMALNLFYLGSLLPLVQIRILGERVWPWLRRNLLPFLLLGLACFGGLRAASRLAGHDVRAVWVAGTTAILLYAALGYLILSADLRSSFRAVLRLPLGRSPTSRSGATS